MFLFPFSLLRNYSPFADRGLTLWSSCADVLCLNKPLLLLYTFVHAVHWYCHCCKQINEVSDMYC